MEACHAADRALVVIADNVEGAAPDFLVKNKLRAGCKVVALRTPGIGDYKRHHLRDLAVLTGGTVFTDSMDANRGDAIHLGECELADLGEERRIRVHADKTQLDPNVEGRRGGAAAQAPGAGGGGEVQAARAQAQRDEQHERKVDDLQSIEALNSEVTRKSETVHTQQMRLKETALERLHGEALERVKQETVQ